MIKRSLCALVLVASVLSLTAQPALADTEAGAAGVAVSRILGNYMGVLFKTGAAPDCSNSDRGGNCWWWAAETFMALVTYAEDNPGSAAAATIKSDLDRTYRSICGSGCPTGPNQGGTDPFVVNPATGNIYYDDIGWWTQTWINAFKATGIQKYLYLAEQLWNYTTSNGWRGRCGGGVIQFQKPGEPDGSQDADANSLYLRNSAWLYSITGSDQYLFGIGQTIQGAPSRPRRL